MNKKASMNTGAITPPLANVNIARPVDIELQIDNQKFV